VRLQRVTDLTETERATVHTRNGFRRTTGYAIDTAKATGPGVVIGRVESGRWCSHLLYSELLAAQYVLYVTTSSEMMNALSTIFFDQLNLRRFDSGSAQAS